MIADFTDPKVHLKSQTFAFSGTLGTVVRLADCRSFLQT
jgi:hypothetical protein